jgi:hypothetical protein
MYIAGVLTYPYGQPVGTQYRAFDIETFGQVVKSEMPIGDATANAIAGGTACYGNIFNPTNNTWVCGVTEDQVPQLYIDCNL